MGQLFLWTQKINESQREEFASRFGFEVPHSLMELYENLPGEFMEFLGFYSFEDMLSESKRPPMMMPGLVPFGEESDGDRFCFYLPWTNAEGRAPIGIWMHETSHFLPLTTRMQTFLHWWLVKETLNGIAGEEWDEMRKILEVFQGSCGLDDFDMLLAPPASVMVWHENLLHTDERAVFPLVYLAANQFAVHGPETSIEMLENAERAMPHFGASTLWQARLHAMSGRSTEAHHAYWRHLKTPMFANGYHYWWQAGDLQIPESSELEALQFIETAETPPPREYLEHPKFQFLQERDITDYRERLMLSQLLEKYGHHEMALTELENAFFIQSWDDVAAREILESLLCIYPEQNRLREAEQCRRALDKLREKPAPLG